MALEAINIGPVNFINFKVDLSVAEDAEVATTVKLIVAQGNNHSGLQHLRRQCRGVATGHSRLLKNAPPVPFFTGDGGHYVPEEITSPAAPVP